MLGGLGLSWDVLGGPGVVLATLGGSRGGLGQVLGQSWGGLGRSWKRLGERLGAVLGHLGTSWRHPRASWRYLGTLFTWIVFRDQFFFDFMKIFRYVEHVKKRFWYYKNSSFETSRSFHIKLGQDAVFVPKYIHMASQNAPK